MRYNGGYFALKKKRIFSFEESFWSSFDWFGVVHYSDRLRDLVGFL